MTRNRIRWFSFERRSVDISGWAWPCELILAALLGVILGAGFGIDSQYDVVKIAQGMVQPCVSQLITSPTAFRHGKYQAATS